MNHFVQLLSLRRILPLGLILLLPAVAHAHVGVEPTSGLAAGLAHPFMGLDHLCAMMAVGLWAAQRGGRVIWLVPLAFVTVMAAGGVLGMFAISIPFVEPGILTSVFVLDVLIAAAVRLPLLTSVILVGFFALFHGHAHGSELPSTAAGFTYALGFLISTILLHLCGIGLRLSARRYPGTQPARYVGAAIVACGLYLSLA